MEGFFSLELISLPVAYSYSVHCSIHGEFEKEKEIRARREPFIGTPDFLRIEAPDPLIGHGREVVAIKNDNVSLIESRTNSGLHMFMSVFVKQVQFLLCR